MKTRHELSQGASFSHLRIATSSTLFILAAAIVVFAAGEGGGEGGSPTAADGALVRMDMDSQVAVLLDEIPVGSQREAAAGWALAQNTSFWTDRAQRQTRDTYYRLVFRGLYYPSAWANASKARGPLPLPPQSVWHIQLTNAPARVAQNGHDLVTVNYHFQTYLVTDAASPGAVEPNLAKIGGSWDEPFNLPSDPELLLERTGHACMDEFEYPVGSVFEENTWYFYDDTCKPHSSSCHPTVAPKESCVEALQKHTGIVKTNVHFTRVPYDPNTASAFRVGAIANPTGADLSVVTEDMVEQNRIFYRYFAPGSCDLAEGTIAKLGWRRLLVFSATVRNDGTEPIHIGDPTDPLNPWVKSNVFVFSPCHQHYHFSHYGNFGYNGAPGSKRAFCLEDTNRFHNDEVTPLTAIHQSCEYQGIGAGWGDEYEFGLPGQWVDITDVDATQPHALTFDSNPDQFLCEGQTLDANNNPVDPLDLADIAFDPTSFIAENGLPQSRIRCLFPSLWQVNNHGETQISSPGGSFVTDPCTRGQIGPVRDCGFQAAPEGLLSCTPGATVNLSCKVARGGGPQVVRGCERSAVLGVGVACAVGDSVANAIVDGSATVSFTCPAVRDGAAGAGGYALYTTPLLPTQTPASVTFTAH